VKAVPQSSDAADGKTAAPTERLIGTAQHICQIFDCFSVSAPALTLTEVARKVGLRKSSVYRLMRTLVAVNYLAFDYVTHRYRLGERIGSCARVYMTSTSVATLARPLLERLRICSNETVTLQRRAGNGRQVVAQMESTQSIRAVIDGQLIYPLDFGAAGHVLRAYSTDWRTYPDREKLEPIRKAGYAVSRGEYIPGAMAIYCPVPAADTEPVEFVVGVQGPEFRLAVNKDLIMEDLFAIARELAEMIMPGIPIR
jgi:DNA-binding IclR family transcriptional regulator